MNNTDAIFRLVLSDDCRLPPGLRLFALALAQLADWRTGRGIAGQGRLARAMGCGVRTVREHKAKLAAASDSPVTVTWRHRSRPDGMNGSDAYQITPSDTGRILLDSGNIRPTHRQVSPTNLTTGSPQGSPQNKKKTNSNSGGSLGHSDPDPDEKRRSSALRVNASHAAAARRAGAPLAELQAEWIKLRASSLFDDQQHLQRAFGAWLKGEARPTAAADDDEWVPIVVTPEVDD